MFREETYASRLIVLVIDKAHYVRNDTMGIYVHLQ